MAENVVRVSGLTKTFGKNTVLSNVNISLERGKIYGFIGQNGAGKTTLINHINGLLFPDEGEIELFGASDSKGLVNARKRIGTVCEHAGLHDNYNAVDNIKLNMKLRGIKNDKLIEQTIANVGLQGVGKKKFRNYSMGMKQRLAIGCAMLSGPESSQADKSEIWCDDTYIQPYTHRASRAGNGLHNDRQRTDHRLPLCNAA